MDRAELLDILNLSTFIAFDLETTGLDPVTDHIIEIAAIRFVDGGPNNLTISFTLVFFKMIFSCFSFKK